MDYKFLYMLLMTVVFLCIGTTCTLLPHRVQSWAMRSTGIGLTGKIPALQRFVSSRAYVFHVRAIGIGALLVFALLALAAIKSS